MTTALPTGLPSLYERLGGQVDRSGPIDDAVPVDDAVSVEHARSVETVSA